MKDRPGARSFVVTKGDNMITIQPEAKSRLLCARCGHSEDDHNWSMGPCSVKDKTHCVCYAFVSPLIDTQAEIRRAQDAGQDVYEVFS